MAKPGAVLVPRATYRLQFHKGFGFDEATALAPYLSRLGISHVYASPYSKARPGSTHGYDIVDHDRLNPALGDEAAFARMTAALGENGIGQVLDFRAEPHGRRRRRQPALAGRSGVGTGLRSMRAGSISIGSRSGPICTTGRWCPSSGTNTGWNWSAASYSSNSTPRRALSPSGRTRPINCRSAPFNMDASSKRASGSGAGWRFLRGLSSWRPQVERRAGELKVWLSAMAREHSDVREAIDQAVARLKRHGRRLRELKDLHTLIQISIGARAFPCRGRRHQLPPVLQHQRPGRHADGLARRIRPHTPTFVAVARRRTLTDCALTTSTGCSIRRAICTACGNGAAQRFHLIVEKILAQHENLREDWPVQGTTAMSSPTWCSGC